MSRDLPLFILKGVVIFLLLELLFYPLRGPVVSILQGFLPSNYTAVWACTGLDEVFLYIAFVVAFPSKKRKLVHLMLGTAIIELYNILRILVTVKYGNPLLHDLLFRWGGFLLVTILFFIVFRDLSSRQ